MFASDLYVQESPYYGGYGESRKSDKKLHDSRNSDDNKLPTLGTQFSVMRFTRNPFKHEASSGDGPKVQNIVSGFEKTSRGLRESKKPSLTNTVILEEDPLHEDYENDKLNAFDTGFRPGKC